ncbi:MAG: tetratricopeptide repeat protein, partial [Terriglobales bacterium]
MKNFAYAVPLGLLLAVSPALQAQKAPSATAAAPKGAHPKSKEESQALSALTKMANDPATTGPQLDAALTDFVTKYPTSDYLSSVAVFGLEFNQNPAHQNYDKSLLYGEQAIKNDPNGIYALTTMGDIIPSHVQDTDLDRDQRLKEATDDDNQAIKIADTAGSSMNGKPFTDAQKNEVKAIAYASLARIATLNKDYANAVANFQKAIPLDDQPHQAVDNFYMARAYIEMKQYPEALA